MSFVLVMAICGIVATFFLNWVFLAVVGVIFVPICVLTMVLLGAPLLSAVGQAMLGYVVLQVAYGLAGWGMDQFGSWRNRPSPRSDRTGRHPSAGNVSPATGGGTGTERGSGEIHASMSASSMDRPRSVRGASRQASAKLAPSGPGSKTFPLFGGWLPLAAFYDPPCQADGSPWNGQTDPGYRMTILVLGWFNRAISVRVGSPKPWRPQPSQSDRDAAIAAMDERVKRARASETNAHRHDQDQNSDI